MLRLLSVLTASCLLVSASLAHMVLVVPQADGKSARVVFSDSFEPDARVKMDKVAGVKLTANVDGKAVPVEAKMAEAKLTVELPANTKFINGSVTYGLPGKGDVAYLLVYHPKAVMAGVTGKDATSGTAALELVPITAGGKTKFQLLAAGKPVAASEGTITLPDGKKEKVTTDKDGFTTAFDATGRYGAYFKFVETKAGEHEGAKYTEVRHYATLVVDVK